VTKFYKYHGRGQACIYLDDFLHFIKKMEMIIFERRGHIEK